MSNNSNQVSVISFITMRRAVGILGISFPIILVAGSAITGDCTDLLSSISYYYHTCMRNIFVAILCSVGFFLFSYKGYNLTDHILTSLAGLFAFGIALFPGRGVESSIFFTDCIISNNPNTITSSLHFISAALFFLTLAFISLLLFTIGDDTNPQKRKRNRVYRICGWVMLISVILLFVYFIFIKKHFPSLENYRPVFWLEAIPLLAFGISWLTKGEVIWRDAIQP